MLEDRDKHHLPCKDEDGVDDEGLDLNDADSAMKVLRSGRRVQNNSKVAKRAVTDTRPNPKYASRIPLSNLPCSPSQLSTSKIVCDSIKNHDLSGVNSSEVFSDTDNYNASANSDVDDMENSTKLATYDIQKIVADIKEMQEEVQKESVNLSNLSVVDNKSLDKAVQESAQMLKTMMFSPNLLTPATLKHVIPSSARNLNLNMDLAMESDVLSWMEMEEAEEDVSSPRHENLKAANISSAEALYQFNTEENSSRSFSDASDSHLQESCLIECTLPTADDQDNNNELQESSDMSHKIPQAVQQCKGANGESVTPDTSYIPRGHVHPTYMEQKLDKVKSTWRDDYATPKLHKHRLELEKMKAKNDRKSFGSVEKNYTHKLVTMVFNKAIATDGKSLDECLVKHKSQLEKFKEDKNALKKFKTVPRKPNAIQTEELVLKVHKSRLELEKEKLEQKKSLQAGNLKKIPNYMRPTIASNCKVGQDKSDMKMPATHQSTPSQKVPFNNWCTLSSMKKPLSRLEKMKADKSLNTKYMAPTTKNCTLNEPSKEGLSGLKKHRSKLDVEIEKWHKAANKQSLN